MKRNHVYVIEKFDTTAHRPKWFPFQPLDQGFLEAKRQLGFWRRNGRPGSKFRLRKYISNPDSGE